MGEIFAQWYGLGVSQGSAFRVSPDICLVGQCLAWHDLLLDPNAPFQPGSLVLVSLQCDSEGAFPSGVDACCSQSTKIEPRCVELM
jgi:hypothetical protein